MDAGSIMLKLVTLSLLALYGWARYVQLKTDHERSRLRNRIISDAGFVVAMVIGGALMSALVLEVLHGGRLHITFN